MKDIRSDTADMPEQAAAPVAVLDLVVWAVLTVLCGSGLAWLAADLAGDADSAADVAVVMACAGAATGVGTLWIWALPLPVRTCAIAVGACLTAAVIWVLLAT